MVYNSLVPRNVNFPPLVDFFKTDFGAFLSRQTPPSADLKNSLNTNPVEVRALAEELARRNDPHMVWASIRASKNIFNQLNFHFAKNFKDESKRTFVHSLLPEISKHDFFSNLKPDSKLYTRKPNSNEVRINYQPIQIGSSTFTPFLSSKLDNYSSKDPVEWSKSGRYEEGFYLKDDKTGVLFSVNLRETSPLLWISFDSGAIFERVTAPEGTSLDEVCSRIKLLADEAFAAISASSAQSATK